MIKSFLLMLIPVSGHTQGHNNAYCAQQYQIRQAHINGFNEALNMIKQFHSGKENYFFSYSSYKNFLNELQSRQNRLQEDFNQVYLHGNSCFWFNGF